LYCPPINTRVIKPRIVRWVAEKVERLIYIYINAYKICLKSKGNISLGRLRHKWEDIIKMNLNVV